MATACKTLAGSALHPSSIPKNQTFPVQDNIAVDEQLLFQIPVVLPGHRTETELLNSNV